jgi:Flp pilus assembly protein TadD
MTDGRKGELGKYIADIQKGMPPLDGARDAFGDLKQLDRELTAYADAHSFIAMTVSADVIPVGQVTVRRLGGGESAMMRVRIESKAGLADKAASSVAAEARSSASDYRDDPIVQSALAEAELNAKDYAAAEAAADRALAGDPNNVPALITKGHAELELARANPRTANWDSIRGWLLKANKLDTENAEPLALYYDSFVAAGERPTENALDALFYAVDVAPRDPELRFTAVRALIVDNELKDAMELFASVAYEPHLERDMHDLAIRIMTAMAGGDAKTAVSLLDQASDLVKKKGKH